MTNYYSGHLSPIEIELEEELKRSNALIIIHYNIFQSVCYFLSSLMWADNSDDFI